jgi:hypothetical protein
VPHPGDSLWWGIYAATPTVQARSLAILSITSHMSYRRPDGTEEWMAEFRDNEGRPPAPMCQARAAVEA